MLQKNQRKHVSCQEVDCGFASDWGEGKFQEVIYDESNKDSVLITRYDGQIYATAPKCSHYSMALAKGVLSHDGTLVCPLHDAAFCVKTGKPVRGPGLQAIQTYPVNIKNGRIMVTVPDSDDYFTDQKMVRRDPLNKKTVAIVGAGAAGICAAETLRAEGFTGRVVLIGAEKHAPYDRPVISKALFKPVEEMLLRTPTWLKEHDIEFVPEAKVKGINAKDKVVEFDNPKLAPIEYDDVIVAPGAQARKLPIPGADQSNVFTIRNPDVFFLFIYFQNH